MKRYKHSLSHYVLSTFDMGQLVPVCNFEVLPGDSVRMSTSALVRCSPLMTPVMHPCTVRLHHWYVPYRVLWDGWEDFITGGPDGDNSATPPTYGDVAASVAQLGAYLGVPTGYTGQVNAFPFNAYNKIFNENYRDQDLVQAVAPDNGNVQRIAWEKDLFTAARPWPQKGPEITLPLGATAPVRTSSAAQVTGAQAAMRVQSAATGALLPNANLGTSSSSAVDASGAYTPGTNTTVYPANLYADLAAATAVSVDEVRRAFALQRYEEARAQFGSRYTEYLRYLGVRSSDARLQRPEYLGGGRATISFSEVLRTGNQTGSSDADEPIGEMAGHGISAMRTRSWTRFFEEHGIVMTLASVRPRSIYVQGLQRQWFRRTKEDYWQKELEQIGQQEVLNKEIYANGASPDGVFGYNDRYYEYRHNPSYVTGEFRTLLNDWHLGREFAAAPALNASFVQCNPTKRVFAEQTQNSLWCMFSHSIQARRLVSHRTIGRIF